MLEGRKLNNKIKSLFEKYLTDNNIIYDNSRNVPAWYNEADKKIHINLNKDVWDNYQPEEVLVHETCHLIDKKYNILANNKNILSLIRSTTLDVNLNIEEYQKAFNDEELFYNMSAGDTISLLTANKVKTFYYHPVGYANVDEDILVNIETAYLMKDKIALELFNKSDVLRKLKTEIVEAYSGYTK